MLKKIISIIFLISALGLTGCNDPVAHVQPLIVDLNVVAKTLGRDQSMGKQVEDARQQLSLQFAQVKAKFEKQLLEKEAEIDAASKTKKKALEKELELLVRQVNVKLNKTRQVANQKVRQYRKKLVDSFRQEVMLVAEETATARKASVVLAISDDVLWRSDDVDITEDIIAALQVKKSAKETPKEKDLSAVKKAK